MFHQLLTPVGGSLTFSFLVGILPIATVLVLLGVFRRPAWQASLTGLIVGVIVATSGWHFPVKLVASSMLEGTAFALWPILWIPFNALLLYNLTVSSGRFAALREWLLINLPNDRRVVLIVIGFCFGSLLEGVAGSGTPVAIGSALLISVGWKPLDAVVITLIFDTAPVAFGALGLPVTILGLVTHLPTSALAAMMGRQLPFLAFILPFYVMFTYSLGLGVASLGVAFSIASAFLGWTAVFLTGSDTSGNALFGNLQVVAARQLGLDPVLFASTNSSGGVMGKMISPQNVSIGVATTELRGNEGTVFAKAFPHSVFLTLLLGCTTLLFQFVFPGLIPH